MPKILREMQSFANVAANAVSSVPVPVTKRYAAFALEIRHGASALMTKALMKTHLAEIRLRVTSKVFGTQKLWEISGANLIAAINDFYGIPSADGVLILHFASPYWTNPAVEDFFSLGTADLESAQLEVKWDATVVTPELKAFAYEYTGANAPLGRFIKLAETNLSNSATGYLEEPDLPVIGNGVGLKALHLTTAAVDEIELRADGVVLYEDLPTLRPVLQDFRSLRTGSRTQDAGFTHLDFGANRIEDVFDMTGVRDFRAKMNRTATGAFVAVSETVIGGSAA